MKKKFKKKRKALDRTNGSVIYSSSLLLNSMASKTVFENKGKGKKKKTSQRATSLVRKISVE